MLVRANPSGVELDITSLASAEAAVRVALERFGRVDVLVNNAGNFYAGFFDELTPDQTERQLITNLVGPMNVTRAVLPLLRKQRAGTVVSISSTAGVAGQELCSAYAASEFGVEGWMESLRFEVEPFGIHTTIVEPGFFRTELLTDDSTAYAELSIDEGRRRRRRRNRRAEGQRATCSSRCLPRAVLVTRSRRARAGPKRGGRCQDLLRDEVQQVQGAVCWRYGWTMTA
jgi:NAD(P)-dependent dehydrogenase (short-subunit alcohol dehydrogenase family)